MSQKNTNPFRSSRRDFLKVSALAGGGMLIGVNFFQACQPQTEAPKRMEDLDFQDFNAFIRIAENGQVSIYSPNPEIGQGVKTAMPMIVAEELDAKWEDVRVEQAALDTQKYTRQVAGGSQSIRLGWDALRQSGATARAMLIAAAASIWEADPADCTAQEGRVRHRDGREMHYGQLVNEAAKQPVPEQVSLKDPKDFRIIGRDAINVDMQPIITGQPLFGLDFKREGMLYASVMRPPSFGQTLLAVDDAEARAMPGVAQVLLFGDKVAVLANSTWNAMQAKRKLKPQWSDDTRLESTEQHDRELIALFDGPMETRRKDGDVARAFAQADQVVERTYASPFLPHNCLEPMNFFAHVRENEVELVGPIQTPERTRTRVAELLNRPEDQISVSMTRMGGGFGRRLYGDFALEAAEISQLSGKPVQVVFSREDDMEDGIYRPAIKYRIAASIKDNQITGYHLKEAAINSNMYGLIPHFFPAGAIPNYQVDSAKIDSKITTGAWRAPYTNFLSFAEQAFFDELFELMGADKVQARLDLLERVKGHNDPNIQYDPGRMQAVIRKAVEVSGWGKPKEGIYQGFVAYYCHNTHVAEVAEVRLENRKPVPVKVYAVVDCGVVVNPTGARNQVEGAVIDGIGHALYGDFTFSRGKGSANNFDRYRLIRMTEKPDVEVHFMQNGLAPTGLGEPALPPAGAAFANAVAAATGQRLFNQPFAPAIREAVG